MRLTFGLLVKRRMDDLSDFLLADLRLSATARANHAQILQAFLLKALTPRLDRRRRHTHRRRDLRVGSAISGQQQNPRALHLSVWRGA